MLYSRTFFKHNYKSREIDHNTKDLHVSQCQDDLNNTFHKVSTWQSHQKEKQSLIKQFQATKR